MEVNDTALEVAKGKDVIGAAADAFLDRGHDRQVLHRACVADEVAVADRFGKRFINGSDTQRRGVLDEIAYTSNPDRGLSQAIAFFNSFRDLTASGFWSTKLGIADLQYQGNTFVSEWTGCPDAALKKLGVS